jgi:flagellar protein FlgJ
MIGAVNLSDRLAVDVQGAQSLRGRAASGDPEALRAAAKQFEAMVVQTMLKTMRQTRFTGEGDAFGDSSSLKMYQEMLDQQWAQKMVAAKGLGFADAIVKRMGVEADGKVIQEKMAAAMTAGESAAPVAMPLKKAAQEALPMPTRSTANVQNSAGVHDSASIQNPAAGEDRKGRFLSAMLPHAQKAEAETGVPARFILAHAALESGWGQKEIRVADGGSSHNLFGIKATGWSGESAEITTTEYRQGIAMKVAQKFRAYADYGEGFTDYARLIQRRYGAAASADAETFANGLANGGYATDPAYADKLRRTIASVASELSQV